jgi:cytochrome o ubiquinol oxidase subunit II
MNKRYKLTVVAVLVVALLLVAGMYLHHTNIPVLEPRGPIADKERHLIIITVLLALIVVLPVFALLFAIAWRYREGNTTAKYSPDLDHSVLAETLWWVIPSALILVLSVIIWNSSHQLDPYKPLSSANKPVTIQVIAMDWKWLFIYPEQNIATVNFVQFPQRTPVNFEITADAPMNSFWIPQLGGQIYAMPGMMTQLHLAADQTGRFYGSSANISGRGFAGMNFVAKASTAAQFSQWVQTVKHAPATLNASTYNQLSKASQNNPVTYYSSGEANLYNTVIMKYLGPSNSMGGMRMNTL